MKRVVVGLSGGVDSSVAAWLLKEQGYEVIGMFMKNWHDDSVTISNECPWLDDSNDAVIVAQQLGIPFQTIDLSIEYKKRIVDYMFSEYEKGRTPNPDILCNREIKFDIFLNAALKIGADFVATGHYARKEEIVADGHSVFRLLAGKDSNKDQSYFLCQLTQAQLSKALFPIGGLKKSEVREIAAKIGLSTASKKDSQGLCFIGKVHLPEFLQQQLKPKPGNVVLVEPDHQTYQASKNSEDLAERARPYNYHEKIGRIAGKHTGAHFYTIGQRKGLNMGGFAEPVFVIGTDTAKNIIYMGMGEQHPGLYRQALSINQKEIHWVRPDLSLKPGTSRRYQARIRYRQPLQECLIIQESDKLYILFNEPQRGITPGQFAAWYDGEELIGSGVIAA
jgi:tRNA-specific 2-thiouridylase